MQKERVTDKEAIFLFISFIIGTTLIIGTGGDAKNDSWIAAIVGAVMAIPILFVFSRLLALFPGKDLFDIVHFSLGKFVGNLVVILYILYAFHLGALVLRNFGEFINTVAMPETPMFVPLMSMGITSIIAVKLGLEVLGRTTTYFFPALLFILILMQFLGIPLLNLNYLKPIMGNGIFPVLSSGFSTFSFPFAEVVVLVGVFGSLQTSKSSYKVYFWGALFAAIILTIITIRNIAVLGSMVGSYYFPSYEAVGRIRVGNFLERMEVTVSTMFIFGVFVKSSLCLLAACKGIEKLFRLQNYRSIVIHTGLLMIYLSYIIYDDIMEMKYWAFKVYPYYAFPMQVILPVMIWIFAEVKKKKGANPVKPANPSDPSNSADSSNLSNSANPANPANPQ